MHPKPPALLLLGLMIGSAWAGGNRLNTAHDRMAAAAAETHRWKATDVRVEPQQTLDRAGCTFFVAAPTDRAAHESATFAVLPDGRIAGVDLRGDDAAAAVLAECGGEAPADWWASVLTRLSASVGGMVLTADANPYALRKVRDSGAAFSPPALKRGARGTEISFFVLDVGLGAPAQVHAVLDGDGALQVATQSLRPARR